MTSTPTPVSFMTRAVAVRPRAALFLVALTLPFLVSGCEPIVSNRGNMLDEDRIAQVKPGTSSKNDVFEALGSPTIVSTFDDNTWYYVGERTEREAFFTPELAAHKVIEIKFDDSDHVRTVDRIGLDKTTDVEPFSETTPAAGREITFIEQLLGNIGRPGAKKKKKGSDEGG